MVRAFMTDASLLDSLNGQQYLVVRPAGSVASFYETEQGALLRVLPDSVTHPNTGHVTLRPLTEVIIDTRLPGVMPAAAVPADSATSMTKTGASLFALKPPLPTITP